MRRGRPSSSEAGRAKRGGRQSCERRHPTDETGAERGSGRTERKKRSRKPGTGSCELTLVHWCSKLKMPPFRGWIFTIFTTCLLSYFVALHVVM